jgi:hypothetical protein
LDQLRANVGGIPLIGTQGVLTSDSDIGFAGATLTVTSASIGRIEATGDVLVSQYIKHKDNETTLINFTDDRIRFKAGNIGFLDLEKDGSTPYPATINPGGNRINFRVVDRNTDLLLKTDSEAFKVNLYHAGNQKLETTTDGINITGSLTLTGSGHITASGDLRFIGSTTIRNTNGTDDLTIDPQRDLNLGTNSTDNITLGRTDTWAGKIKFHTAAGNSMIITGSKVGIGTTTPSFALDVTGSLSNTSQGGVVRFESSGSGDLIFNDGCEGANETAIQFGNNGRISGEGGDFNFSSANNNFTFNTGSGIRNITTPALTISGSGEIKLDYDNMPTSDPNIKGVVYRNGSNQLFISAG